MDSSELLDKFRTEMGDQVAPYFWQDEEIFEYADDAQVTFCRKTDGISDATTEAVTTVPVLPNTDWVDLHPSILKIRDCARSDTGQPIEVVNREDMPTKRWFFDGNTGTVRALVIGIEDNKARVFPKSNETVDLLLTVFRKPLTPVTDIGDQALEIAAEHHVYLLLWMKHRAYSKNDADTFDKTKAAEFEGRFNAYCEQVQTEQRRKRHKNRTVAYGGI